jgi:Tfp pilus assembly protein FimT
MKAPRPMIPRGFTFLEIIIAITLGMLIVFGTMPFFDSVLAERRIRRTADQIAESAVRTRLAAESTGRVQILRFDESGLQAPADSPDADTRSVTLHDGLSLEVSFDGEEWQAADGQRWVFAPTGQATPLSVRLEEGERWLEMEFDLLTARVAAQRYSF